LSTHGSGEAGAINKHYSLIIKSFFCNYFLDFADKKNKKKIRQSSECQSPTSVVLTTPSMQPTPNHSVSPDDSGVPPVEPLQREVPHSQQAWVLDPHTVLSKPRNTQLGTRPGGIKRPQWQARSMGLSSTDSRRPGTSAMQRAPSQTSAGYRRTAATGLSYSRGGSKNYGRAALAASHAPDSDSDPDEDGMSQDSDPESDVSSDDEEFEVAIDDDCSCAACRWNLERSKEWEQKTAGEP